METASYDGGRSVNRIGATPAEDAAFAHAMLPNVSRTFARAIGILPPSLGDPVRLSYLLCRAADTMEDAAGVDPRVRRAWLLRFCSLLSAAGEAGAGPNENASTELAAETAARLTPGSSERELIEGLPCLFRLLSATDAARRRIIERWTSELALGMARFVRLEESAAGWTALETCKDLDAYEYYVAGTVGCLLEELISLEIGQHEAASRPRRPLAVAFGLGLQGTNILQDLSDDRARGWCYVPEEIAGKHGTSTARMHEPALRPAGMEIVREMSERAVKHLDSGIEFVLLLPRRRPRIRLFCLWPLLLALRTLARLASDDSVFERRIRVSRPEVKELTREATWRCISNTALRRLYEREKSALIAAMNTPARTLPG
jgi:farnesyl-diphosphate farnesyltransferase